MCDDLSQMSFDELMAEFAALVSQTEELRQRMKNVIRQIEARGADASALRGRHHSLLLPPEQMSS